MNKFYTIITAPLRYLCYFLLYFYKFTISKLKPKCCIYEPTCSTYMLISIYRFGVFKGIFIGTKRLFRCGGKHTPGVDPVPDNLTSNITFLV